MWFVTKRTLAATLFVAAALALAGCAAMADPEASDLPWAQTNEWELAPNLPQSMLPH